MAVRKVLRRYDIVSYCKNSEEAGMVGVVIKDSGYASTVGNSVLILASRPGIAGNGYVKGKFTAPFTDWVVEHRLR